MGAETVQLSPSGIFGQPMRAAGAAGAGTAGAVQPASVHSSPAAQPEAEPGSGLLALPPTPTRELADQMIDPPEIMICKKLDECLAVQRQILAAIQEFSCGRNRSRSPRRD